MGKRKQEILVSDSTLRKTQKTPRNVRSDGAVCDTGDFQTED